jgi:putative ABC transport system permease protein
LGIVIGISSVIAMVSIGSGASKTISSSIESLGSNLLRVSPGAARTPGGFGVSAGRGGAKTLTQTDADALSPLTGVGAIASEVSTRSQVTAKGTNTNTTINGVTSSFATIRTIDVSEGSFVTDSQNQSAAKVAVLGPTARDDLFGVGAVGLEGQSIRIKGMEFKVIGITVSKGGTGFANQDDIIYIPEKSAQRYLSGDKYLTSIDVQASSAEVMTQLQDAITTTLLERHHISDPALADFNVLNQADILASASSITTTLTYLLAAIGGISLVVGGIGIMNMMLTTVTERTREIGLRKAIGARRSDINQQFLIEAIALTLIGGVIGIILGWLISSAVNATGFVTTSVSISSVLIAFGVSALTGIVFGYYPARRAAGLNPIDALRYE